MFIYTCLIRGLKVKGTTFPPPRQVVLLFLHHDFHFPNNNIEQNVSLFILLVNNKDVEADRNSASQLVGLERGQRGASPNTDAVIIPES